MKRYQVVIEKAPNNYSAYVPDLPGCITTGSTIDETLENIKEAIGLHLETMADLGIAAPEPTAPPTKTSGQTVTRLVEVAA